MGSKGRLARPRRVCINCGATERIRGVRLVYAGESLYKCASEDGCQRRRRKNREGKS